MGARQIPIRCPHCQGTAIVSYKCAGTHTSCPWCTGKIRIPGAPLAAAEVDAGTTTSADVQSPSGRWTWKTTCGVAVAAVALAGFSWWAIVRTPQEVQPTLQQRLTIAEVDFIDASIKLAGMREAFENASDAALDAMFQSQHNHSFNVPAKDKLEQYALTNSKFYLLRAVDTAGTPEFEEYHKLLSDNRDAQRYWRQAAKVEQLEEAIYRMRIDLGLPADRMSDLRDQLRAACHRISDLRPLLLSPSIVSNPEVAANIERMLSEAEEEARSLQAKMRLVVQ